MPNDAKLGLVIGVGLVIAVAVVFFRRDEVTAQPSADPAGAATAVNPTPAAAAPQPPPASRGQFRPARAQTAIRTAEAREPDALPRQHTVRAGDTLFGLAQRYYGDGDRFVDLYRANRNVLKRPDALEPGTVLLIPQLPQEQARAGDPANR